MLLSQKSSTVLTRANTSCSIWSHLNNIDNGLGINQNLSNSNTILLFLTLVFSIKLTAKPIFPAIKFLHDVIAASSMFCFLQIDWPLTATHVSGVIVDVLQKKKKKQIFHMRSCKFNNPIPPVEGAVCKVGKNKHKALIRITWEHIRENQSSQRFRNCRQSSTNFFVCDDWIELDAYCAVHIM